jgi:hypothetical protein
MEINSEMEFTKFMLGLLKDERITKEEYDAVTDYVCGIFDALSEYAIYEEDLT